MPENFMEGNNDTGDPPTAFDRLRGLFDVPPSGRQWYNPLEKIEELMTCPICLERYKTPKLLPCQHTFCMEPCLDGLVDPVRRVVKCPECRAEHPMPYDGPKAFQTNYTLMGFLEIHLQASEENAEELESYIRRYNLERCKVCDEKAEVVPCPHCEKKVCLECKASHIDMIKRDLSRVINQVKRLSNRITEASDGLSKGVDSLAFNCDTVKEEIKDFIRRYVKDLKKKEERLLSDMETFRTVEIRLMKSLRESLELESSNINEACARVEACLKGEREASDDDLVRFKHMFAEGLDYLRTFNPDADDLCMKKIRFSTGQDPNAVTQAISQFGELYVCTAQFSGKFQQLESLYVPRIFSLGMESDQGMKIKKRLWDINDSSTWNNQQNAENATSSNGRRYGIGSSTTGNNRQPEDDPRSLRYRRRQQLEEEAWKRLRGDHQTSSPSESRRSPRNYQQRDDLLDDTSLAREHVEKSPFSKVQQMNSSITEGSAGQSVSQSMNQERARESSSPSVQYRSQLPRPMGKPPAAKPVKQQSTDDKSLNEKVEHIRKEHEQNKQQNKVPPAQESSVSQPQSSKTAQSQESSASQSQSNSTSESGPEVSEAGAGTSPKSPTKQPIQIRAVTAKIQPPAPKTEKKKEESEEEEEEESEDEEAEQKTREDSSMKTTGPLQSIPIVHYPASQNRKTSAPQFMSRKDEPQSSSRSADVSQVSSPMRTEGPLDWKKFLIPHPVKTDLPKFMVSSPAAQNNEQNPAMTQSIFDRRSSSRDSDSESAWADRRRRFVRSKTNPELLGSISHSRVNELAEEFSKGTANSFGFHGGKTAEGTSINDYRRRFGASRPDSGEGSQENAEPPVENPGGNYRSNIERRSRYRRKAEKSHTGSMVPSSGPENSDAPNRCEINISTGGENGNRFFRVFIKPRIDYLDKGRLRRKFGTKGAADSQFNWPRGLALIPPTEEVAVCDSSNHRVQIFDRRGQFVRSFGGYGSSRGEFDCLAGIAMNKYKQFVITDRYNHRVQIFDANGRFLREFGAHGQTNGRFNNPWGVVVDGQGFIYVCDKDNHRVQIFQADGNFVGKFGMIGNREGQFQNPHFIAVNRQNQLIVTDSSNHRVQVFDHNGHFQFTFGSEGFHEGQFKHPRGVAVDDQGFVLVADSGNNRIQVFYPDGRFLSEFGTWGSAEGQLKGVEGVAVSMDGHVIVSDRENHRIQVF